ncbi:MAG: ATP-binding cassette domain-containing protein [Gammaproteobacteria bacterium]|nr:ATP-binding cassette domain-containing protein [Gammaproteobacteria bacterium]
MSHSEVILQLSGIHKRFDELEVLKGVDLTAKKGDVVALIGSSGSGKSTLLRCANLLEQPEQGDIVFRGDAVKWAANRAGRAPADADQVRLMRTNLSMVFQQFNLWQHMTILQNVMEAPVTVLGQPKDQVEQRAVQLLDRVGIGDKLDKYPSQLSGGQQQRAAIARALCMEPAAMLFDEPTSALDPELEAEVIKVIRELASEGRTMIIVTHDMNMARDLATEVIFLHQGLIEEKGTPSQVLDNPKSERLQQFLSATAAH